MALLKAKISIKGKRPLLFHRFSVDSIPLERQERTGVAGNNPEEWKNTVLKTQDNQLYLESSYIFGCLRDGGKHIKSGRGTLQAKVASTLVVLEEIILLDQYLPSEELLTQDKTQPVYLDIRGVKNPNSKGSMHIRYRVAAAPGWSTSFSIEWENTLISRNEMTSILNSAGSFVGLGDGRSIGFGRFEVTKFKVQTQ
ncbi:hypothetical protein [Waddlia chondrophila]|uniref:CRISPR-associated RAMP superfamily protein n=1 Tax=Waddlia chondrophila (strain ATCC VR-1470 / WSU 86-1044) TaxID=716544 RepID=D6YV73_WADCW|nr:hypothetical protein [Waddlia chondrophila]ADI38034.1 conserved hypothetical protein [Waddlia chondrophila WSU 86-1044]